MKVSEFLSEVEKTYSKHFPESRIDATYNPKGFYRTMSVVCFLAGKEAECINGYWDNDMLNVAFSITNGGDEFMRELNADSELPEITLENYRKSYYIKPIFNKYNCYDRRKLSFRKVTGSGEKIIARLDKFFLMLKNTILDDVKSDYIHGNHAELVNAKVL